MHTETRGDTLHLTGDITVKTLTAAAFARFTQQCASDGIRRLDFSGVKRADSACVSLLLSAMRLKKNPVFDGVPDSVRDLAALYEIGSWLDSDGRAAQPPQ